MSNIEQLFAKPRTPKKHYPKQARLIGLLNPHTHPRGGVHIGDGRSELFVPYIASVYEDAVGIGNTPVPLTTTALALAQGQFWNSLVPKGRRCRIHVAVLATERSDIDDIIRGLDGVPGESPIMAVKMFIRSVSNSNGSDVDDIDRVIPLIQAMFDPSRYRIRKHPPVFMIHAERKFTLLGRRISFLDRERVAVERDIEYILKRVPNAVIVVCHVSLASTIEAIEYYQSKGHQVYGEIAPHYAAQTTDDLFEDGSGGTGFNSHVFCLPILKTSADRMAILGAMLSRKPYFHFGDDEACHNDDPTQPKGVKTNSLGITVGGQTQIPEAVISYVLEQFFEAGLTVRDAQRFLADNARRLYGLPAGERETVFVRDDWEVSTYIERELSDERVVRCRVAMGGQVRKYKLVA